MIKKVLGDFAAGRGEAILAIDALSNNLFVLMSELEVGLTEQRYNTLFRILAGHALPWSYDAMSGPSPPTAEQTCDNHEGDYQSVENAWLHDLTSHKISCREPSVHATQHTLQTADTPNVNRRLARGQLHRLVRLRGHSGAVFSAALLCRRAKIAEYSSSLFGGMPTDVKNDANGLRSDGGSEE